VSIVFAGYGEYCEENGVPGYQADGGDREVGYMKLTTDLDSRVVATAEDRHHGTRSVTTTFNDETGALTCVMGTRRFLANSGVSMNPGTTKCDLEFDLKQLHRQLDAPGSCKRDNWFPYLDLFVDVSSTARMSEEARLEFSETTGTRLSQSASLDRIGRFGGRDVTIHLEPSSEHHAEMPMPVPERLPLPNRVIRVPAALDVSVGEIRAAKSGDFLYDPSAGYTETHYRFRPYKEDKECLVPDKDKVDGEYKVKDKCDDEDAAHRRTSSGQLVHEDSDLCMEWRGEEIVLAECIVSGDKRVQQWQLRKRLRDECEKCGQQTDVGNLWHNEARRCLKYKKGKLAFEDPGIENCDDDDHFFFFDSFLTADDDDARDCHEECVDDRNCNDAPSVGSFKGCIQDCLNFCT
jgi:hypothetical protein